MGDLVRVEIEVSEEVAQALRNDFRRRSVGALVDRVVGKSASSDDPLMLLFAKITEEARAAGLTEGDVQAELAAYNAERRR